MYMVRYDSQIIQDEQNSIIYMFSWRGHILSWTFWKHLFPKNQANIISLHPFLTFSNGK